ncbi:hypothetical protein D3C83_14760 [compost metagenome]
MPGVDARSVTDEVGSPTTKKKPSIFLSFTAFADSATPRRSRVMSFNGSMPAASRTRNAMTSVALPGEPVDRRLPLRSFMVLIPVPSTVTTCMMLV